MSFLKVVVIGGGAAGFFAALSAKQHHPNAEVVLLEGSNKILSKVKVSGGGRCNVTHSAFNIKDLIGHYPRGGAYLKKAFQAFAVNDTVEWFETRGVRLKTEADGRMFPITDDSQSVIDLFVEQSKQKGIGLRLSSKVKKLAWNDDQRVWEVRGEEDLIKADKLIVATGGSPKLEGFAWLGEVGHTIVPPVPSLFTFNLADPSICALAGVSAQWVKVRVQGPQHESIGPVLITHWGLSGPAVLRTSAFSARHLHEVGYSFHLQINWLGDVDEETWRASVDWATVTPSRKKIVNENPTLLPSRLWEWLVERSGITPEKRWVDLGKKDRNRLLNVLTNDVYEVRGKTTFKEEFVTAGGIDLSDVDPMTSKSKLAPELYFAGEVMDIDGVTGGFNFQAAWTTAWIAGQLK